VVIRLPAAMLLGAVIGIRREQTGKPAGRRTHMPVALGAALFVSWKNNLNRRRYVELCTFVT
jgi:uncharacterized membrane protein YhiD involved in acid resistance